MRLFAFIVLILLIILLACAPFLLPLDSYRAKISDHLSQRLHRKVLITRLEIGYFPPALRLKDVSVMSEADNNALVHVDQITAPVHLQALFKARIVPRSLDLRGWTATVLRRQDGTWAWDEWLVPAAQTGASSEWPLESIVFDRGECSAVDPYAAAAEKFVVQILQGRWERARNYTAVNGVFTSLPVPVSFLFQGSGQFFAQPTWTGVLGLTEGNNQWKLDCRMAAGRFQATSHSDLWRFDTAYAMLRYFARLPIAAASPSEQALLQNWTGQFDRQGSTMTFNQSATLADGRAEATGAFLFDPRAPRVTADVAFQGIKLPSLQAVVWGHASLEGTATGAARFSLLMSSAPWSGFHGQGAMELQEGRYFLPEPSMQRLSRAHTMRYLSKKFPSFLGSGLPYKNASAHWQMKRGVITFGDAFCNLGDIKVAMAGSYDAERRGLDAFTRVQILERNPQLLKELPANYVYVTDGKMRTQPMHGSLQGTPAEWRLRAVPASKIPSGVRSQLSKSIQGK